MKKLAIVIILLLLIVGICFAAASDYKVDNNGNIYGYGLHILTTGTFLNILSGAAYFQTPLGISSGGTGTNVAISMVNSFNTRTGVVSLTAADVSSVYTGSTNLTILGTIATGTVPWSHVSGYSTVNDTNVTLSISSSGAHTVGWTGTLADGRIASASIWNAKQNAVAANAPLSFSTPTISISLATTTVDGYISAASYSTFNAKQNALNGAYVASFNSSTGNITTPTVNDTNVTLSIASGQTQTITAGWTGTLADGRIASAATWNGKQDAVAANAPLSFSTPTMSISKATSTVDGYLASSDWTTFNAKVSSQWTTSTNGTSIYYNGGHVGIGTTTPGVPFHIYSPTAGIYEAILESGDALGIYWNIKNTARQWGVGINALANFMIRDITGSNHDVFQIVGGAPSGAFYMDASGNVGIGTSTPVTRLTISGGSLSIVGIGAGMLTSDSSGTVSSTTNYVSSFNSSTGAITTPTVNDTNVTLSIASGQTQTITAGWTGTLADARITSATAWNAKADYLSGTTNTFGGASLGSAGTCTTGTATVSGATTSMTAIAQPSDGVHEGLVVVTAFVSSANTVSVSECAITAVTPAARRYYIRVIK